MTRRGLWITGLLVAAFGLPGWANVAPTMEDQYIVTVESVPVAFDLRASDEDVDPSDPAAHPLRFVILECPEHGVLVGNLAGIRYQPPHDAVVEMTYAPAQGFVGTDIVVVSVSDPFGESADGTTTIRIDVEAERAEGLLSGDWNTNLTYDVQSGEFTVFHTSVTGVYRVDHLALSGTAVWKMETQGGTKTFVFDALRLKGAIDLWDLDVDSTLEFDPEALGSGGSVFDYWRATTELPLLGVQLGHTFYLTVPQMESYQILTAQGEIAGISVGNTLRFDMDETCSFVFGRNDTYASWRWCDVRIRASLASTCEGFQEAKLTLSGVPLPLFGCLPPGVTLDFVLKFEPEKKSFSASLDWQPARVDCLKVMAKLGTATNTYPEGSGESIASIDLYGFKIECEFPTGIQLVSATSLHPDYNSYMTGLTDYFEVFRISAPLGGCCDIPGHFRTATYFHSGSTWLFDWGMTSASFDVGLSEQLSLSLELVAHSGELTATAPWTEFSAGWTVRW